MHVAVMHLKTKRRYTGDVEGEGHSFGNSCGHGKRGAFWGKRTTPRAPVADPGHLTLPEGLGFASPVTVSGRCGSARLLETNLLCSAPPTPLSLGSCISLQDLHRRIDGTRLTPPLEDSRFHYGFNSNYLKKILSYWRNEFDWGKQVEMLNRYPHFKTRIEGMFPRRQRERGVRLRSGLVAAGGAPDPT